MAVATVIVEAAERSGSAAVLATLPARAQTGVVVTEPPSWVEPTPVDAARPLREEDAVSGLHVLLSEEQVRVSPDSPLETERAR